MKLKNVFLGILAVLVATAVCPGAGEDSGKINLKLNLKAGQTFKMTLTTDQKMQQSFQGMPMDVNTVQTMDMLCKVMEVDSNNIAKIKMTYGDMKMKMDSPQGRFEFDSAKPDPNAAPSNPMIDPMKSMWSSLKGMSIIMKVDSQGKTTGYEGFDEMLEAMTAKMSEKDPNIGATVKGILKQFMNEDSMGNINNDMYGSFPSVPVAVGDVWDSITSVGGDSFPIDTDVTYMLKEIKNGTATITSTAKIDMGTGEGKLIEQNGMKMNLIMTGVMNGYSKVDVKTGWLIESEVKHSMNGSMKMAATPQMPDGMTMPMKIEGKTKSKSEMIN